MCGGSQTRISMVQILIVPQLSDLYAKKLCIFCQQIPNADEDTGQSASQEGNIWLVTIHLTCRRMHVNCIQYACNASAAGS